MAGHTSAPRGLEPLLLAAVLAASGCGASSGTSDAAVADAAVVDAAPPDAPPRDSAEPDALVPPALRILATPAALVLNEGVVTPSQVSFRLDRMPSADVVVDLTLSDPTKAALATSQLRFAAADLPSPQAVNILASNDDDAMPELLTLTASSPGLVPARVTINIIDDDDQSLRVSPFSASIDEGQSMTFQVRLTLRETRDISAMINFDSPAELTASPNPIVIPAAIYPASVTLTVTALHDADVVDDTHTMTVSSPGNAFSQTVSIVVLDDD